LILRTKEVDNDLAQGATKIFAPLEFVIQLSSCRTEKTTARILCKSICRVLGIFS